MCSLAARWVSWGRSFAISVALASDSPGKTTIVLVVFAALAAAAARLATHPARPRTLELIGRTLHSSGQLGVRISVLLCVLLVWMAATFGLDVLLGAFAAGMLARLFLVNHATAELEGFDPESDHREEVPLRLESLGFGFFIPLFFVISGIRFDLGALENAAALAKVPIFLVLFLLVRGLPALLYRRDLARHDVLSLGLLQVAALPLLVGAGLLSVVILPILGLAAHHCGDVPASVPTDVPLA